MARTGRNQITLLLLLLAVFVGSCADSDRAEMPATPENRVHYCILFGIGDTEPTKWDGSIEATGARVLSMQGWRLDEGDAVEGNEIRSGEWKLSTRHVFMSWGGRGAGIKKQPVMENGLYLTAELTDANPQFQIQTAEGDFSFRPEEAPFGKTLEFLEGRVSVERVPLTSQLTASLPTSMEEQDHPATVESNRTIYLAYVEFTHGDRSQSWPRMMEKKPDSYEPLSRPAGGDQVMLIEYSKQDKAWGTPAPVSRAQQDIFRTAVAIDGDDRLWVIWSARTDNNFDLYARYREGAEWSEEIQITENAGPDLNPVAAASSDGTVWVAWQGYRDSLDILVARQDGDGFSSEQRVSVSDANDWDPQIAADQSGDIAIVWDTYEKGDYDVYVRRMRRGSPVRMDEPIAVAASEKFEARPSAVYDSSDRLWIAYEESYRGWGKDFGAYETTGTGLYLGIQLRLKILSGDRFSTTADSLEAALARETPSQPVDRRIVKAQGAPNIEFPNPELAKNRRGHLTPYRRGPASKSYPRLTKDNRGTIVLAYRNGLGMIWVPLGTSWAENVVYFDGSRWVGPIFVPYSDGVLDSRPALARIHDGRFMMVGTTDHRFTRSGNFPSSEEPGRDKYNYDLVAYEFDASSSSEAQLQDLETEQPVDSMKDVQPELDQVARMRKYRVDLGPENLQLLRGEFHRHTEISADGGMDGAFVDAWRYMLDAAYMDWVGCCDHDNGSLREYTWWITQKYTDAYLLADKFIPMFSYERSIRYPEGHRNVIFAQRGVRSLPRLPKMADDSPQTPAPDTEMLYEYLEYFDGIAAVHTSGTSMGTDWRNNNPKVEPVVEIYQGDRQNYEMPGAPRANSKDDSIGAWRPMGFVSRALAKGYRLGFQASSDHISTHMSYCNLWVTEPTREAILEAFKKRRVYGATDNILADVRCAGHLMGEEFRVTEAPTIEVKLTGTDAFADVHIIKDGKYAYSVQPRTREVDFSWKDNAARKGKTSYYYVRGEQADGELVWVSPMWITLE